MDLTVVIATCRPSDLTATLKSLSNCTLPANFSKTIIVENGTPEPTLNDVIYNASPKLNIKYMHCREGNKSSALNHAIHTLCENQLLFMSDDDVRFDKDVLIHYANASEGQTTGKVYGGTIKLESSVLPPSQLARYIPASMLGFPRPGKQLDMSTVDFIGPNWAAFSDDIKKLGGFDRRFGPGSKLRASGQETQMMRSLRSAGCQFEFIETAIVWHKIKPENYTESFIADRKYRNGIEVGIRQQLENRTLTMADRLKLELKSKLIPFTLPLIKVVCTESVFLKNLVRANLSRGRLVGCHAKLSEEKPTEARRVRRPKFRSEQLSVFESD